KDSADLESVPSPLFRVWEGMPQSDVPEHLEPDLETEILTSFKYRGPICTYLDANELPADLLGTSCWLMRYIGSVARILLAKVKEIETGLSIALLKTKESGLSGFGLDQMSDEEDEDADELEDEPEEDAKVEAEPDHKPATPTTTRDSPFRSGARSQSITSSFGDSDTIEQLTSSALPELTRYVYAPAREVIAFEPISSDHRYDVQPPHYRLMPIEEAVKRADERRDLKKRLIQAKKEIVRTFLKEIESESDSGADEDEEPAGWRKWFPYRRRAELVAEAVDRTMKTILADNMKKKALMLARQRTLSHEVAEMAKTVQRLTALEKKTDWGDLALQRMQYDTALRRNDVLDSDISELKNMNADYTLKLIHSREELDAKVWENRSILKNRDSSLKKKINHQTTFTDQHKKLAEVQEILRNAPKITDYNRLDEFSLHAGI
ncbi:unnamed protein product, partial [Nesidiocoris tenuis]